jgi:hypothetical protein
MCHRFDVLILGAMKRPTEKPSLPISVAEFLSYVVDRNRLITTGGAEGFPVFETAAILNSEASSSLYALPSNYALPASEFEAGLQPSFH